MRATTMESEMRLAALRISVQKTLDQERNGINPNPFLALETIPCICCERPSKWFSDFTLNLMSDPDLHEHSSDDLENDAEMNPIEINEELRTGIQDSSCCSKLTNSSFGIESKSSKKTVSSNFTDRFYDQESYYCVSQKESLASSGLKKGKPKHDSLDGKNLQGETSKTSEVNISMTSKSEVDDQTTTGTEKNPTENYNVKSFKTSDVIPVLRKVFHEMSPGSDNEELKIRNKVGISMNSKKNVVTKIDSSTKEDEVMVNKKIPDFQTLFYNLQQKSCSEELSSDDTVDTIDVSVDSQVNFNNNNTTSDGFVTAVPVKNMMIPLIENLLCVSHGESSTDGEHSIEMSKSASVDLQKNAGFDQTKSYDTSLKEENVVYDGKDLLVTQAESSFCDQEKESSEDSISENEGLKRLLKLSLNLDSYEILPPVISSPYVEKVSGKIWKNSDYKEARDQIYSKIAFHYDSCIIVWCPLLDTRCELVHLVLPKYGKIITKHDRWMRPEYGLTEETWGGVFVVYETEKEAKLAAREIPKNYRFMNTLELSKLLHCLVKSELQLFKQEKQEGTDVFVNLPVSSNPESQEHLKSLLHTFGEFDPENCYNVYGRFSIQYKMSYTCAAYGFLAMTVLDGHPFRPSTLKVEVKETPKEKAILKDLLYRLRKYTAGAYFPLNGMP